MSGFTGINTFGNLTLQNGQRIDFKDIKDVNGDGKIDKEEFSAFLKENNVDSIDLSTVDKDGDGEITEKEYTILEQKQQMQEAVNNMAGDISFDFAGTDLIPEVAAKLKELIGNYENNYNGDITKMAEAFKNELPANYETIKNEVLASDPATVQKTVISDVIDGFIGEGGGKTATADLEKALDTVANAFVKSYKGNNLAADLNAHLNQYLQTTDAELVQSEVAKYQSQVTKLGANIESGEVAQMREAAYQLLNATLNKGVTVKLGDQSVSLSNLQGVLNKYTDGNQLKADIQSFIDSLSTVSKKDTIVADALAKDEAAADKAFGECKVDSNTIDYSNIPGYAENAPVTCKGKGNRGQIQEQARQTLESLKDQMKAQIESMLQAKGLSFDMIATDFDNIFYESLNETVAGIGNHKTNHAWLNKNKRYASNQGIQEIVQGFIANFNAKIESRMGAKNASDADMDLVDIDYTAMVKDENGNVIEGQEALEEKLQNGGVSVEFNKGANLSVAENQAKEMIDRLKPQMLKKAMNMCKANGVEFDNTVFTAIFNNSKNLAVTKGSADIEHSFVKHTHSFVNPQEIATTFTTDFKTNYTAWVDAEKTKNANE